MPLIKEMFHRQSRKRTCVVSPISKSQSECSNIDFASSVASFTSANDDNETYLHAIDNRWLQFDVLYVFLVIDIDRLMDSDLFYHWFCFIEMALHCRCLLIGSVTSKMGLQMNVQVYTICKHYSIVLYIYNILSKHFPFINYDSTMQSDDSHTPILTHTLLTIHYGLLMYTQNIIQNVCQIIGWWSQKRVPEPYNSIHVYHGIILISFKHLHYIISLIILQTYYVYYISNYLLFLNVSVNCNNYYSSNSPYIKTAIFYARCVLVCHNAIFIDRMNFGNNHSTFILGYIVIYYLSSYIISNRYNIFQCVLYCIIYLVTKCFNINATYILSYVGPGLEIL